MLYGEYLFTAVFEGDAIVPPYKGSTFRGVFGSALKRVVCALRRQECVDCLLRDRCIYHRVFETPSTDRDTRHPSPPHPFVIEPPLSEKTAYSKGDSLEFTMILFGWANDYLPYFVYAVQQMGDQGIGRRIRDDRGIFSLSTVRSHSGLIFSSDDGRLLQHQPTDLILNTADSQPIGESAVRILLQTPLRIKHQNQLQAELPFHVLVRAMLRRISALNRHFGGGEPNLDYRGLVSQAQEVQVVDSTLRWFDWKRYSNRQEQSVLMGGIVGDVTYRGRPHRILASAAVLRKGPYREGRYLWSRKDWHRPDPLIIMNLYWEL